MKNSTKILSGGLIIAMLLVVFSSSALAYRGDPSVEGPDASPERHAEMEAAFETNDYEAWKSLMADKGRVTQVVNADNFAQFAEAHQLAEQGDLEGSKNIRAELGLGLKNGSGKDQGQRGSGFGKGAQFGARDGSGSRGGTSDCTYNN